MEEKGLRLIISVFRRRPLKPIESSKVRNATFPLSSSASVVPTPLPMSESDNKSRLGRRTKTRFLGSAVNNNNGHLNDQDNNNNNNNLVPYESSPSVDLCNNINICSSDDCDCGRLMMTSLCNENTRLFNDGDFFASHDDNQRQMVVYDNSNIFNDGVIACFDRQQLQMDMIYDDDDNIFTCPDEVNPYICNGYPFL